jgi:hypothetical protein
MPKHIALRQSSAFDLAVDLDFDLAFDSAFDVAFESNSHVPPVSLKGRKIALQGNFVTQARSGATRIPCCTCRLCGAENGSEVKLFERSEFASFPILRPA